MPELMICFALRNGTSGPDFSTQTFRSSERSQEERDNYFRKQDKAILLIEKKGSKRIRGAISLDIKVL